MIYPTSNNSLFSTPKHSNQKNSLKNSSHLQSTADSGSFSKNLQFNSSSSSSSNSGQKAKNFFEFSQQKEIAKHLFGENNDNNNQVFQSQQQQQKQEDDNLSLYLNSINIGGNQLQKNFSNNSNNSQNSYQKQKQQDFNILFESYSNNLAQQQGSYQEQNSNNNNNSEVLGSKKKKKKIDRFIPNRKTSKLSIALTSAHTLDDKLANLKDENNQQNPNNANNKDEQNQISVIEMYKSHVLGLSNKKSCYPQSQAICTSNSIEEEPTGEQQQQNSNIFHFQDEENQIPRHMQNIPGNNALNGSQCSLQDLVLNKESIVKMYNPTKSNQRKIAKIPFKVLDAPQLQDDYYLNLIDWGSQNQLAVALASCVYLWNAENNKVVKFCDLGPDDMVTSVQWNPKGTQLSIGTSQGEVQIWDAEKVQKLHSLQGHSARVGSLAWGNMLLSSGSRDKTILQRDLRVNNTYIQKLEGHKQEVCGIKWSFDGQQLASGGNDNKLMIWNLHSQNPIAKLNQHCAAVKALAWSPHQHSLLASGGGTADRTIRFWNTNTYEQIKYLDTGSQVCNLMFGKNENELVSTHGYSMNQISIWKYPTMEKIQDLHGHTSRVLFLAASPDGETLVTGAGDETLRFWKIFPQKQESFSQKQSSLLVGDMRALR